MCGIVGFYSKLGDTSDILNEMLETMFHRGPDSFGTYISGHFSGGMRRLSINGVESGEQPLFNQDKTLVM